MDAGDHAWYVHAGFIYFSVGELFKHWFAALFQFTWLSYITTLPWGLLMRWRRWGNEEEKMKERMNNLKAYSHQMNIHCKYSVRGQMLNKNTRFQWAYEYVWIFICRQIECIFFLIGQKDISFWSCFPSRCCTVCYIWLWCCLCTQAEKEYVWNIFF